MQSEQPLFLQEILSSPHCHSAVLEVRERFGRNCLELALEKNQLGYFQAILQSPHLTQEMIVPQASRGLNIINAILYSNLTSEQKLPYVQAVLKSPYGHALMQDTAPGFSPLFIAVDENEAEIVQALLNSPHCTTELLKRQEKDDAGLTPLQNLLLRNRDERVIIEMFLKSPACTMDVLKMQYWGQKSCLKSLQEHDDWEKFKPYVVDKNKAFLESQMFMNVTNPKEGGDFINTVNSLKNLMFTVFEPLNDLLVPAFQQAIDDYNQNQDMGVFIQNCVQALTAAESELKNHQISFDNSSSESISIEELADDAYASDNSNESCYSSDSNLEATNALELIKQLRNQIQIFESSLLQRIKTATQNYLDWCASHAQGHRFVTRFSHFFHGSSGQARAQRILNLINDGASYDVLKPHLDQVLHESGHRKHSYSRYLYVGIHDVPQDEVFELSDQDFLRIKHN